MFGGIGFLLPIIGFLIVIVPPIFKVLREYERAVVFTLGRVGRKAKGPGLIIIIPLIQRMVKV
ncbi:MAG: slipin family protein, partial [Marinicaulis sp.]|nr:slipin family protein [Marinicaulis sp.]